MNLTIKDLLEAGVHFGHQTRRWNPKMAPYIFGARNGIYIIDLKQTLDLLSDAGGFAVNVARRGGKILFVATKRQAEEVIGEEAGRCGMYYVSYRWLGGLLTNFKTIRKNMDRLDELETMQQDGHYKLLPKKEVARLERERVKLERYYTGIREMRDLPDALFVIDIKRERIAVHEANILGIPVVGIVDTNSDPNPVDYVVPGNDDGIRSIRLFSTFMADHVMEGIPVAEQEAQDAPTSEDRESKTPEIEVEGEEVPVEATKAEAAEP